MRSVGQYLACFACRRAGLINLEIAKKLPFYRIVGYDAGIVVKAKAVMPSPSEIAAAWALRDSLD
jgi:hypothetical protein